MRVLITGNGQLATELIGIIPCEIDFKQLAKDELDITEPEGVSGVFSKYKPHYVINAAAFTAVDQAETNEALAYAVNEQGVANLAEAAKRVGSRLIHVSTDFVFNGERCVPYDETVPTEPIGVYGASKRAGEKQLLEILDNPIIIRTSWVYSQYGSNFVKTMLRLMETKEELGVIVDQVGTPTWAAGLARTIWTMIEQNTASGIYHWSDAGVCSWYDFAVAIQKKALALGLLSKEIPIVPIPTSAYPTPAARPNYSVLDKSKITHETGIAPKHWQAELDEMLATLVV